MKDGDGDKPYGDVSYVDPRYPSDGKKRYPLDTEKHFQAYINMPKNSSIYSSEHLAAIKDRIEAAMRRLGIKVGDDEGKAAAARKTLWDAGQGRTGIFAAMHGFKRREIILGGVENNELVFRQIQVNQHGQIFGLTFPSIRNVWDTRHWMYLGSQNPADGDTLDPLPTYSSPYTPSPDGTTITGGAGTVTTVDGVWSSGAPYSGGGWNLMLNGIPVSSGSSGIGYGAGGATPVSTIDVNSYGQLYALGAGGVGNNTWFRRVGGILQINPLWPNGNQPPAGHVPVPIDMTFSRACPNLSLSSPVGTVLSTVTVTMSDASAFFEPTSPGRIPAGIRSRRWPKMKSSLRYRRSAEARQSSSRSRPHRMVGQ